MVFVSDGQVSILFLYFGGFYFMFERGWVDGVGVGLEWFKGLWM
jgi:hypothetical protein